MRKYQKVKTLFYSFLIIQNFFSLDVLWGSKKNQLLKTDKITSNKNELLISDKITSNKNELLISDKIPSNKKELTINFKNIGDILIKNNLELKKAGKAIDEANLNLKLVKSKYNLNIDLDSTIPEYLNGKVYDPLINLESAQVSSSTTLGITLPIFDPGKQPEIDSALERINIAKDKYEKIKKDLILESLSRFIVFVNAYQEVENGNQSVNLSFLNLQDSKARFDNGIGTKLDLLEAKIQLNKDQQFLIDKENSFKSADNALKTILYLEDDFSFIFNKDQQEIYGWWDYSLEKNVLFGLKNSFDLKNIKSNKSIRMSESKFAIAKTRPSFFIRNESTASFVEGESLVPEVDKDAYENSYNNSISLNFSWDIFDGGISRTEFQTSKLQAKIEDLNYKIESNSLEEEIINRYKILKAEEKKILISNNELDAAIEAMELSRLRLNNGVAAQREVINAQKDLTSAKSSFYKNIANYNISLISLNRLTGLPISGFCENAFSQTNENKICFYDKFAQSNLREIIY